METSLNMPVISLRTLRTCTVWAASLACGPLFAADTNTTPLMGEGAAAVVASDLLAETSTLDAAARQRVLSSPENVQRMTTEMYIRRALAGQALAQKLDEDPQVRQLLHIVRERVLADALTKRKEAQSRPTDPVLENLAQQNYKVQQSRFQQPERVHARHILIPLDAPDARAQAETLRKQALEGANFEALAKKNSKDPGTAPKGGDLGLFARGKMIKPFEDAAFALTKPGDLSEVIETRFGFHVIQLVDKRAAGVQPFAEVKEQLMEEAAGGIAASARQELVRPIIDAAKPHPEAIEAFTATHQK